LDAEQLQGAGRPADARDLQQIKDEAKQDIAAIAADNEVPNQVESGKGIQA
jgi:hypothetical protein